MALLALFACTPEEEEEEICVEEPALTWENFGEGHMRTHCNGCHSSQLRETRRQDAPLGVDFDTWNGTVRWAERIEVRTLDQGNMPPLGGPTDAELIRFREWLLCEVLPEVEAQ